MLCTGLKQLPAQVDAMLLPDAFEIFEHWQEWPPEHVLLNGFVGWKHKAIQPPTSEQMGELQSMLGPAAKLPPDLREMIRWAEETKVKRGNA